MKLLFVQGGSRWKYDSEGGIYTDGNFSQVIWDRYLSYCDELTVLLREEETVYSPEYAASRFNVFDTTLAYNVGVPDVYKSVKAFFRLSSYRMIKKALLAEINKADKVIIRSPGTVYTNQAIEIAKRTKTPFLVEVTGFALEVLRYHGLKGKIMAPYEEAMCKRLMLGAPYACYVTDNALQGRYPTGGGRELACSDVEIEDVDCSVLERRLHSQRNCSTVVFGTAGSLDFRVKNQIDVIRALALLDREGFTDFRYELIGGGSGAGLMQEAKRLGIEDRVVFVGQLPRDEVSAWLDGIGVYVCSSLSEGLSRAVIEAMGRACPVICTDAGGNIELASASFLYTPRDVESLAKLMLDICQKTNMDHEAKRSFRRASAFQKHILDARRDDFYREFIEG